MIEPARGLRAMAAWLGLVLLLTRPIHAQPAVMPSAPGAGPARLALCPLGRTSAMTTTLLARLAERLKQAGYLIEMDRRGCGAAPRERPAAGPAAAATQASGLWASASVSQTGYLRGPDSPIARATVTLRVRSADGTRLGDALTESEHDGDTFAAAAAAAVDEAAGEALRRLAAVVPVRAKTAAALGDITVHATRIADAATLRALDKALAEASGTRSVVLRRVGPGGVEFLVRTTRTANELAEALERPHDALRISAQATGGERIHVDVELRPAAAPRPAETPQAVP